MGMDDHKTPGSGTSGLADPRATPDSLGYDVVMSSFTPGMTTWHITFGTYGTRLHGGERITVDKQGNTLGDPFVHRDPELEAMKRNQMRGAPVHLSLEQRQFIQGEVPAICEQGGWLFRSCAAQHHDHIHILLDIPNAVHGEKVRRLLKRWLTQSLETRWPKPVGGRWWAEQGRTKRSSTPPI